MFYCYGAKRKLRYAIISFMRYCPGFVIAGICYRRGFVIDGSLLSVGPCYHWGFVIGGALLSPGLCYHRGFVIGGALLSPGLCYHRGFVITGAAKTLYFLIYLVSLCIY